MLTKMKAYFFPANTPKVILYIILFGMNAEIRINPKTKTHSSIYTKETPIAIIIELAPNTKIEICCCLYSPNRDEEKGKKHVAIQNIKFTQIRVRFTCLM